MGKEVIARLNNLRLAPRKVRLLARLVEGLSVNEAVAELELRAKRAARPLQKLIQSAAANAEHNFKLQRDDLMVKQMIVDSAVTLKRYMPRAFGRAATIRKRSSHVTVTVESRSGAVVTPAATPPPAVPAADAAVTAPRPDRPPPERRERRALDRTTGGGRFGRFGRRLFQRKSGT